MALRDAESQAEAREAMKGSAPNADPAPTAARPAEDAHV